MAPNHPCCSLLQQLFHPLDKRRELIWILLRKRFINLQGLFKSLPRLLWSVLGPIQNTQIVERRGDVRQISLRLFLRQLTVNLEPLLIFLSPSSYSIRASFIWFL